MTRNGFREYVRETIGANDSETEKIYEYYLKHRLLFFDVNTGVRVKHGVFLDKETLESALDVVT